MSLPTFFLVGAPKAGTSSLFERLTRHPDVYASPVKEPHYFAASGDGWPDWRVRTRDAYEALFDGAGAAEAVGDGSTWYLYSPTAAASIHALVPDARILIALRNPVDRAFSAWGFNVEKGWETVTTFEEALALEDERAATPGFWDRHYVRAGLYADQVERYIHHFGRSQVRVVLFDDLLADGEGVVRDLYDFLGLRPFEPPSAEPQNATRYPRSVRVARLVRSGLVRKAARWVPAPLRSRVRKVVHEANTAAKPTVRPETRDRLEAVFRADVERLGDLIDRPLAQLWFGSYR